MAIVVLFNIYLTGGNQIFMLLNLAFALTLLDWKLAVKGINQNIVDIGWWIVKIGVYCGNFVVGYRLVMKRNEKLSEV